MTEHAHDGVELGTALGEFGSHRMAEPMHGDRGLPRGVVQPGHRANALERRLEQMALAHQLSAPDEHEPHQLAGSFIGQVAVGDGRADRQHAPQGFGRLVVEWDHPLARGLADRDPQARRAIGIAVEAIGGETTDFAPPRPDQRATIIAAR